MGTLAIDIETASPDEEPPSGEYDTTSYFELVAVALGFRSDTDSRPESDVLFRDGGWDRTHTAKLLDRLVDWVSQRDVETVLTYNGTGFDFVHLRNWATATDENGLTSGVLDSVEELDAKQVDLKRPAIEHHGNLIKSGHDFPKFERVCDARSVPTTDTKYADYDVDSDFLQQLDGAETVQGWHIGKYLGEWYVDGAAAGITDTRTHQELKTMLSDYARADVRPLFDLYDSFDAPKQHQSSS